MIEVDFKQILEEDPKFKEFAQATALKAFSDMNNHLIPIIWSLYQSGMTWDAAAFTLKMMIKFGGPPYDHPPRRNSKV